MIRDITLGQYYPANSVLHRLDSCQIRRYFAVYHLRVCVSYISGVCGGDDISGGDDWNLEGSREIYVQGTESDFYHSADYGSF